MATLGCSATAVRETGRCRPQPSDVSERAVHARSSGTGHSQQVTSRDTGVCLTGSSVFVVGYHAWVGTASLHKLLHKCSPLSSNSGSTGSTPGGQAGRDDAAGLTDSGTHAGPVPAPTRALSRHPRGPGRTVQLSAPSPAKAWAPLSPTFDSTSTRPGCGWVFLFPRPSAPATGPIPQALALAKATLFQHNAILDSSSVSPSIQEKESAVSETLETIEISKSLRFR